MKGEQIFEKISDLKEKFRGFFQQRKQVTALENHSHVRRFSNTEHDVLATIKRSMKGSFLEEEDAEWMTRKLDRLNINYLDWAHRTRWLKQKIAEAQLANRPKIIQAFFDFDKKPSVPAVPIEILNASRSAQPTARI